MSRRGGTPPTTARGKAVRVKTAKKRSSSSTQWLQRQLNEAMDQMLILGVSDLSQLNNEFAPLFAAPAAYSMMVVYRPARESDEQAVTA